MICRVCGGDGKVPGAFATLFSRPGSCPRCGGSGTDPDTVRHEPRRVASLRITGTQLRIGAT